MTSESPNALYFASLHKLFERTPALSFVKQTLEELAPGRARLALEPDDRYNNGSGCIHGGIIATVLDGVGWFACATRSEGYWLVTAEFKVNFLEVASRERVIATGELIKRGSELFHARMDARTEGGRHVATALGTYSLLPRKFQP
ncbi:PaaI family thioesterase [Cystobacter fuscus]|uniref:PaaI family thioesterase n=1 Tax=Cystobacter fuscus TaxID=43 RepID=UPI002B2E4DD7|nr:PaaI family thioesterase [Cystobacter fuscus]